MLRSEEKELRLRLTEYTSEKINKMVGEGKWTNMDIARLTGISQSRISDIKNRLKIDPPISRRLLLKFIYNGIITIPGIKSNFNFNDEEMKWLDNLDFLELEEFRSLIMRVEKKGIDVKALFKKMLKDAKKD